MAQFIKNKTLCRKKNKDFLETQLCRFAVLSPVSFLSIKTLFVTE